MSEIEAPPAPVAIADAMQGSSRTQRPADFYRNIGPGRPPGAHNKLTEDFLADFHACWQAQGKAALAKVAVSEPAQFVKAAVQLMPRDVLLEARGAGLIVVKMSDEDRAL